jgi:hypothetical protein
MKKQKAKRRVTRTRELNQALKASGKSYPFDIEWIKHYNPMEGKDQIIFIYKNKKNKKIAKWRSKI